MFKVKGLFKIQLALIILTFFCLLNTESIFAQTIDKYLNIQYKQVEGANPTLLSLDIYTTPEASGWKVLIYVHGGGFQGGDKDGVGQKVPYLMNKGYVLVSINYRVYPEVLFVPIIQDTAAAIAWVYRNIADYGGDPNQIFIQGHSSGAHIVALVSADGRYLKEHGLTLNVLKGCHPSDNSGYDIPMLCAFQGGSIWGAYNYLFTDDYEFWKFISPVTYAVPGKNLPPKIVSFSGIQDPTLSEHLVDRMNYAGYMSSVLDAMDKNHGTIDWDFGTENDHVTIDTLNFFSNTTLFTRLTFKKDFNAGVFDENDNFMAGTETTFLETHGSKLFAGISYKGEINGAYSTPGPQILVKEGKESPWKVDAALGNKGNGRITCLKSIKFTKDKDGNLLKVPVSLLMASSLDGSSDVNIYSRNDTTGDWKKMTLASGIANPEKAYVSLIIEHTDSVTGIQHVFVGTAGSGIYSGAYDPEVEGRISWESEPELISSEAIDSGAVANGNLYVAAESNGNSDDNDGGLFMRKDGAEPSWEFIYEWENTSGKNTSIGGLTAVLDPATINNEVLIFSREGSGIIEKIEPLRNHKVSTDFDYKGYFKSTWDSLGDDFAAVNLNNVPIVSDPYTGRESHLIGLNIKHPEWDTSPYNGSYYLVRHSYGNYAWGYIYDSIDSQTGNWLSSCRAIAVSPFSEDQGEVLYFGGFDAGSGNWHNTAWIYRGEFSPNECNTQPLARVDIRSKAKWVTVNDTLEVEVVVGNYFDKKIDMYAALVYNDNYYWFPLWDMSPHATIIDKNITWTDKILTLTISPELQKMMKEFAFVSAITEHETIDVIGVDAVTIQLDVFH